LEKMLLLLAKEDVIPFILDPFKRQHRAKRSSSICCPSRPPDTSPVTLALMAVVWSFICFAPLFLAMFCLIKLHSTALR